MRQPKECDEAQTLEISCFFLGFLKSVMWLHYLSPIFLGRVLIWNPHSFTIAGETPSFSCHRKGLGKWQKHVLLCSMNATYHMCRSDLNIILFEFFFLQNFMKHCEKVTLSGRLRWMACNLSWCLFYTPPKRKSCSQCMNLRIDVQWSSPYTGQRFVKPM